MDCRKSFRNLEVVTLGPGRHSVREDQPGAIGGAVRERRWRVVAERS